MANIRYYSSDHGMGHVARDAAIIDELIKIPGVRVFVRNFSGNKLLSHVFDKNVNITAKRNDFGVINVKNGFSTSKAETYAKLKDWRDSWNDFIIEEKKFCKDHLINLVVSDISPQPFLVASELKIPSVAVTNFTWYCIYSDLFGKDDPIVKEIADCYRLASKAVILPFEQENMPFGNKIKVGLVCRKKSLERKQVRDMLGLSGNDFAVFFSLGFSMEDAPHFNLKNIPAGIKIVSSYLPNAIRIPESFYNSQDIIAACDLVVCKSGYTTVAEAISARVPVILTARDGFVDDEVVCSNVEKLGIGMRISNDRFLSLDFLEDSKKFVTKAKKAYGSLPKRLSSLYNEEAARIILSC